MSGHSKWNNIKNKKAKGDAARSKIFTKIGREIAVAVKSGGSDPNTNSKLFDIVQKAKINNMPNDNISRSIKKAAGELGTVNYESLLYEGYGIGGSAVLVDCLTDNKNRTAGEIRYLFDKFGGALGTSNCVSFMFDKKGVIVADRAENQTEDEIFELAIECGADDVSVEDDIFVINTSPSDFNTVRNNLTDKNVNLISAEIEWVPQTTVTLEADNLTRFQKMIEAMEDDDDIQNVYHNVDLPDDEEE
ncbi:MAG TPA: YebC/PmpR family DNA-binding transcriptional regulator [Eubacteriales bacterium]|nr:YebC/PmpR family DNA-binding transcriptional regulator [Eubacteriales bacterium]